MPDAVPSPSTRPWRVTAGLPLFLALLGLYAGAHVTLRLILSPVVAIDDAREALLSQTLELGYLPRQPPLYNWLVWVGVRLFGVGAVALILCRYLTLSLTYLFLYLSARLVIGHPALAMLAAFSLALMGPFNWDAHEELTHSLAALAAASATFYALLRLGRSGSVLAYLGLGVALAAGFLAKFSYGFFAGSLLIAALATPAYRRRLLSARVGLTLGTALALCLPFALWFVHRDLSIMRMYVEEVRREGMIGYVGGVARGFGHLGRMLLIYLVPVGGLLPAVFWEARRRGPAADGDAGRLLRGLLLAELGLVVAAILGGSLTFLKFRWLMPAFFLVPLLAFTWVDPAALDRRMTLRYATGLVVGEVLVLLALTVNVLRGDALGPPTRLNAPYDAIAAALADAGFSRGTIAAGEGPLAGNLRLRFPHSRAVRLTNPDYLPPASGEGQCLVVWEEQIGDRSALLAWVGAALAADVDGEPVRAVSARYRHARDLSMRVSYILLPAGRGACR